MEIKKYIFYIAVSSSVNAKLRDMYNFYYDVHINLQEDTNIIKMVSGFISKSEIKEIIDNLRLEKEKNKKVHNMHVLRDRIRNAIETIKRKTHSLGFFNAKATYEIKQVSDKNLNIYIKVKLGDAFKLQTQMHFDRNGDFSEIEQKGRDRASKVTASLRNITNVAKATLTDLQEIGYYKPEFKEQRVHVDFEKKIATLVLAVNPGARVVFGDSNIKAFKGIDEKFISNRIAWNKGEFFNIQKIKSTVEALRSSQIFSKIEVKPVKDGYVKETIPDEPAIDGEIPMEIIVEEDKKHMIDASVLYAGMRNMNFEKTSRVQKDLKSIITRFSWTRFNAFNHGEQLRATVECTPFKAKSKRADYAFELALLQPDVFFKDNTADYEISRKQELTNAFFRKIDQYKLLCSYPLFKNMLLRTGGYLSSVYVDGEESIEPENKYKRYKSITFPLECVIDHTDNALNPTGGYRMKFKAEGSFFSGIKIKHLIKAESNFSYNYPIDNERENVISVNFTYRRLFNQKLKNIPLDHRVYCGGIGSVRGYANQMATEKYLDADCPAGGKAVLEFNLEGRRRFTEDFGGVLFFDGAKTFQNQIANLPIEKKRWFLSFGTGIRYFTSIGPIRFDLAFPIKRRKGVDSKMQFIMSLGQTF